MDTLIQGISAIGTAYLLVGMALHLVTKFRSSQQNTARISTGTELTQVESKPAVEHQVVQFKRPVRQKVWTDRELIQIAKANRYPGSHKWSYKRVLSPQVRQRLIELAQSSERLAS